MRCGCSGSQQVTGKAHLLFHLGTRKSSDLRSVLVLPSIRRCFMARVGEDISGSGGQAGLPLCFFEAEVCLALLTNEETKSFSVELPNIGSSAISILHSFSNEVFFFLIVVSGS